MKVIVPMPIADRMTGSIIIASYLLSFGALYIDFLSPAGYTEWVFFLVPLLCISFINNVKHLFAVAVLNSILLIIGYVFSEKATDSIVIFHRILGIFMIWTVTVNIDNRTRAQEILKENQEQLKESQHDLNRAQAVAQIGSWRMDIIKNELQWSEEVYRIFEVALNTPVTYETFLSKVHPEDREYVDKKWHAALDGSPYEIEHRIKVYNYEKWVKEKAELEYNTEGTLIGGFGTVQDITELKNAEEALRRSEEKYRHLFTNTLNGTALQEIITDDNNHVIDYRFLEVNPAFEKIVGLPLDAIVGRTARQLFPGIEHDPSDWIGTFGNVVFKDEKVRFEQFIQLWNKWVRVVAFKTKEKQFCIAIDDVTSQHQAIEELKESENRLKILNENLETIVVQRTRQVRVLSRALTLAEQRERKRFSYILHENLQQQLLGAGLLLRQHLADHKETGTIEDSDDITDGLGLLDKALQTAKTLSIELNPPVLSSEGLDLALEWLIKHMKHNYGLEVEFYCESEIGQIKNETQLMLIQMVRELLYNIVEHSGVHSARLEVICKNKKMQITISDRGKGFNPRQVLAESEGRTRLGLLSIRERLRLFGGELIIESEINEGTRVVISLPVDICK
jgi:signal transduction histidine kinase